MGICGNRSLEYIHFSPFFGSLDGSLQKIAVLATLEQSLCASRVISSESEDIHEMV